MKKIIGLVCLIVFSIQISFGQRSDTQILEVNRKRNEQLSIVEKSNEKKVDAFFDLLLEAQGGNVEAMVKLAYTYRYQNPEKAFYWFSKASSQNYAPAWNGLGNLYKFGIGVELDFSAAYNCFAKSAEQMYPSGVYAQGYMEYKGLGCMQNYELAYKAFLKGAELEHAGAMYMLGLCYLNGYGINVNKSKALFWLNKSASMGYDPALNELTKRTPENYVNNIELIKKIDQAILVGENDVFPIGEFTEISDELKLEDFEGDFEGYLVRYDWSGKHIINVDSLRLEIQLLNNNQLQGRWLEEGYDPVSFKAKIKDNRIIFLNSVMNRSNHYFSSIHYVFEKMECQIFPNGSEVYFNGNVKLFSHEKKEPERPIRLVLKKKMKYDVYDPNVVFSFSTFPNPFVDILNVTFGLHQKGNVKIRLFSEDGRLHFSSKNTVLNKGEYILPIIPKVPAGLYFLSLEFNGHNVQNLAVIKIK